MRITIHYFSATGNTASAVEVIRKVFVEHGHEVAVRMIERGAVPPAEPADLELIAFPTIAFGLPTFVAGYLKRLPRSNGGKAAVFTTFAGHPFRSLAQATAVLRRRGYHVILTGGALYPNNWTQIMNPPEPAEAEAIGTAGDRAAAEYVRKLLSGKPEIFRCPPGEAAMAITVSFLFRIIGRRFLGKIFSTDGRCNGCGLCARTCPTRTISLRGKSRPRPRWGFTCADCGRCINLCPQEAIQTSVLRLVLHGMVQAALIAAIVVALAALHRAVSASLPASWRYPADGALLLGLIALLFWLQFGLFDRLLFYLEKPAFLRSIFGSSFTRAFRRYHARGFKDLMAAGDKSTNEGINTDAASIRSERS